MPSRNNVIGDRDGGGDSYFPGVQDKRWHRHWVDSELKDEWLERLNAIPGIKVRETCAGHPGYEIPRAWVDRLLEPSVTRSSPEKGPLVVYDPLMEEALERVPDLLGDRFLYFGMGECPRIEDVKWFPEAQGKIGAVSLCPEERLFHFFVAAPITVSIHALKTRPEMSYQEFDEWWETVIAGLEKLGR